jgi:hypothetical protein
MPTPAPRTPIRPARGSYAQLLGSLGDLKEGEVCYALDRNTLYVKEGSTLIALGGTGGGGGSGLTIDQVRTDGETKTLVYSGGLLTAVNGAQEQVSISYNPNGTVHTVIRTSGGLTITKTLSYNPDGTLGTIAVS